MSSAQIPAPYPFVAPITSTAEGAPFNVPTPVVLEDEDTVQGGPLPTAVPAPNRFTPSAQKAEALDPFSAAFQAMAGQAHATATQKGFWDAANEDTDPALATDIRAIAEGHALLSSALEALRLGNEPDEAQRRALAFARQALNDVASVSVPTDVAKVVCLLHSEVSELHEALADGNPQSEKIPAFTQAEEELADLVIRIGDTSSARVFDVGGAVKAKMTYNRTRAHKHGNKRF